VVIGLEPGAGLHMAQLMPLPLTVSCFSKIQIGFTFLVPAYLVVPEKIPLSMCVCVCYGDVRIRARFEGQTSGGTCQPPVCNRPRVLSQSSHPERGCLITAVGSDYSSSVSPLLVQRPEMWCP